MMLRLGVILPVHPQEPEPEPAAGDDRAHVAPLGESCRANVVFFGRLQMSRPSQTRDLSEKMVRVGLTTLIFLSLTKLESPRANRGGLVDETDPELPVSKT